MRKGVEPAPTPTPAKIRPLAFPRSSDGIQRETNWLEAGKRTASPAPKRNRAAARTKTAETIEAGTAAVREVKMPHHRTPTVSTRREPRRSANHPPTVWNSAYPIKKALVSEPS